MRGGLLWRIALTLGFVEAFAYVGHAALFTRYDDPWLIVKGFVVGVMGFLPFWWLLRIWFRPWTKNVDVRPLIVLALLFLPTFWFVLSRLPNWMWGFERQLWLFLLVAFFTTLVVSEIFRTLYNRFWGPRAQVKHLGFPISLIVAFYETMFGSGQYELSMVFRVSLREHGFWPHHLAGVASWFAYGVVAAALAILIVKSFAREPWITIDTKVRSA